MARPYETVYIFNSTLEESQINERLDRYHQLLGGADVVSNVSHWGKRSLAYPLGKQTSGYYVVAQFETEPETLGEYERALRLDDNVLRYLVVVNELGAPPEAAEAEAAADAGGKPATAGDKPKTANDKPETAGDKPKTANDKPETTPAPTEEK